MYLITEPEAMQQTLIKLKKEIDKSTITVGDFNIPLLTLDRTDRK